MDNSSRKERFKQVIAACALLLLLATLALRCAEEPTSYLNMGPDQQYVGNQACESCHQKISASYAETGMGKSMYRPDRNEIIETFGENEVVFDTHSGYHYYPFWSGDQFRIREFRLENGDTTYRREETIEYIVGSGHQTRSYLLEREGYWYEAPITWYVNKQIWDLSPGYEQGKNSRFSREIGTECIACHTGNFDFVEGSKNKFHNVSLGIDCERCHGPGKVHIDAIEGGQLIDVGEEIDYTIVNPGKLPIDKQFDVCQQCHLQGVNVMKAGKSIRDFRPGMHLSDIADIFIEQNANPDAFGIASHAERLQGSQCFIESAGRLTCTTCHDPHKSINATDTLVYIRQCGTCHREQKEILCTAPAHAQAEMGGNCITCHMPSGGTSDIPHVSFHDHKIRVVGESTELVSESEREFLKLVCATDSDPALDIQGKAWLQYFELHDPDPAHLERAASLLDPGSQEYRARLAFYRGDLPGALLAAEAALKVRPQAEDLLYLKGEILEASGRPADAHAVYQAAWKANPALLEAGLKAGVTLLRARQGDSNVLPEARKLFEQLLTQKPFDERIHANLGFVLLNLGVLDQAENHLAQALAYDPQYPQALENMVYLYALKQNAVQAQNYLNRLLSTSPDHPRKEALQALVKRLLPG